MNDNVRLNDVPDGNWGWIIVAAVAWINMTNTSITSVFGLLFDKELHSMQGHNTFTMALIANLNSLTLNFSGFFLGPAIKKYRPRNLCISGCLLVSSGLLICCFATQPAYFILGYSICVGFGLGLIAPSTFIIINEYFSTKRGRAVGVSLAGSGVGQVMLPHLARWCLHHYGFQATLMAISGISLTGIFGAMMLKPLIRQHNNHSQHIIKPLISGDKPKAENCIEEKPMADITGTEKCSSDKCDNPCRRLARAMDLELLTDPIFISIIVGMALVYTSTVNFTMLFPNFLRHSAGLTESLTASCMSIVAAADIMSRLVLPCITDKLRLPYRVIFLSGTFGLFLARAVLAESTNLSSLIVMSIFIGICKSATVVNNNLAIAAHCQQEKLPCGLILNMIAKGVIVSLGLFLGWIRDLTHSYVWGLHAQNCLLLLVICTWTPELCYRYFKHKRQNAQNHSNQETV